MILSDAGEARVRGYLYVLERSLRASLPPAVVTDGLCLLLGFGFLVLTQKGARAWLRWIRTRIKRKESL